MLLLGGPWAALGDVVRDGSIGPGLDVQPEGPHYVIPADWGESADSNLFHSFAELSLSSDQSATFTGFQDGSEPAAIENIFARVTEVPSYIDGLVASDIEGANLFILNQHGLMFGPNARLDLSGSFYGSTAHYLRFGEGEASAIFETGLTLSPTLSVEPIAAFGFFESPAPIDVDGSLLAVDAGQSIALVGGGLTITAEKHPDEPGQEDSTLVAPGGPIFLASAASAGEFVPGANGDPLDASSFDTLGDIHSTGTGDDVNFDAIANVIGDPSGSIYIRGSNFVMETASALSATNEGDVDHAGTAVDIRLRGDMEMRDVAEIGASTRGLGRAGNVWIEARRLLMRGSGPLEEFTGVNIGSRSFGKVVDREVIGGGDGGTIDLWVETLEMSRGAFIQTTTFSQGNAGTINLHVGHLSLDGSEGAARIQSSADTFRDTFPFDGNGPAGAVNVWAESMNLLGGPQGFTGIESQVTSSATGNPNAGIVSIHTKTLELRDSAQISTSVFHGAGNGGLIEIDADAIRLSGFGCKDGDCTGTVFPSAITAGVDEFGSFGMVTATAGTIRIVADLLEISDGAEILSLADFPSAGTAGETILDVGTLRLTNSGSIRSDSFGSGGGGNIRITANDILIAGPSVAPTFVGTGVFAQAGAIATGFGSIEIHTNTLDIAAGGVISTSTFGQEQAGQLEVFAGESVYVHGMDTAFGPSQIGSSSRIFPLSPASAGGDGGNVFVTTPFLHIDDGGALSVSSETAGRAGDLVTRTTDTLLTNDAAIAALNTSSGDAGNLHLTATGDFEMRHSTISAVAEQAKGGNIKLDVEGQLVAQDSTISSAVGSGAGDGGNVDIDPRLVVLNRSGLSASAVGGDGGRIEITADQFLASATSTLNVTSSLGIDGVVVINAAESNLVEQITPLPEEFLDAPSLLRSRCGAQSVRQRGSFVVGSRDGAPASPDGFLSAPLELQVPGASAPGSSFDFESLDLETTALGPGCTI
jgi:filamentous hemagglutinin family protein